MNYNPSFSKIMKLSVYFKAILDCRWEVINRNT